MIRRLALAAALVLALTPDLSVAQAYPGAATPSNGVYPRDVTPTARPNAAYSEATVAVAAGTWTLVAASNTKRQRLILGDATGLTCLWSTVAAPAAGQGVPWSGSSPSSYTFTDPAPTNAIYVKCTTAGTITAVSS
jgi:hypothetical protein